MGSKISELTETGVAPTGGYIPIEHESQNYKVSIKTLNEGGLGGGLSMKSITPYALLDVGLTWTESNAGSSSASTAWGAANSGFGSYKTFSIPTSQVPEYASMIVLRAESTARDNDSTSSNTKIYVRSSKFAGRRVSLSFCPNNSDDGSGDSNTFLVPYTPNIEIKYLGQGVTSHNSAKVYIDGYITGGSGGGGEGGIIGYVYCTLPGGSTHEEVLEIDFANQTQSGRNTYNNALANFHLVDLPEGDIIDMHRPTDAAGSVASWSSDTDFSDCNVLGASGAANFHQPWVMMGNWNKLDSNYVPVGYRGEEFWVAKFESSKLHIKPNPAVSDNNVRTFYFAVTKGGGGGQAAQSSSGVNYTVETMGAGGTLEKKDASFFEMHVRQLQKESILVINPADDTFTGFDHSSTRFTTGTLDTVQHKDVIYIDSNNKFQAMLDGNGDYSFYGQNTNGNQFYALIKRY